MRFVTVKSVEQQDIQATHRIRSELITQRTAKANQIRGLVAEYGLVAPQHIACTACSDPLLAGRCRERSDRSTSAACCTVCGSDLVTVG